MKHRRRNWKRLLKKNAPLLLPAASDALTAKLIQQAGFPAYQIGGFALDGMRFGFPGHGREPAGREVRRSARHHIRLRPARSGGL